MTVLNCKEGKKEYRIDTEKIDHEHIISDELGVMVPLTNSAFTQSLTALGEEVAEHFDWSPDHNKTKVYFYITGEEISLALEVFPKHYTNIEKTEMLNFANKSIRKDGYSDYLQMLDTFDCIDHILNSGSSVGEIGLFSITLTEPERELLLSFTK